MRRPSKFPLFWTRATGFNYALYNALEAEADYFLLHDLRDWIQNRSYLRAVQTIIEANALSEYDFSNLWKTGRYEGDVEVRSYFGAYSGEKCFRCPCGEHHAHGRDRGNCEQLLKAHGPQYDDPSQKLTIVITRTVFDQTVCVNKILS